MDAPSPRESESIVSQTPKGYMNTKGYNFDRDLPGSTTNAVASSRILDLSNNVPQTPKVDLPSLDFTKLMTPSESGLAKQAPGSTTNQYEQRKRRSLLLMSPQAEKTRNTLAERAFTAKETKAEDDTMKKDLPEEEFKDFLSGYDATLWYDPKKAEIATR